MPFSQLIKRLGQPAGSPGDAAPGQVLDLETASQEILAAAALADGDETLRAAAARKLDDGDALRHLIGLGPDSAPAPAPVRQAAQERMAQLIDAGAVSFDHDPSLRAFMVVDGPTSHIRQLAAQHVEEPAELRHLLKQVADSDKSVYKIIKQKLDVLRAAEQHVVQIEADIQSAYASLERHSHRIYDSLYVPTLEHFLSRWRSLESHAGPEMLERANRAIEACREVVAAHARLVEQQAAEQARREAQALQQQQARERDEAELRLKQEQAALDAAQSEALREAQTKELFERRAAETQAVRQMSGLLGKARAALREGDTGRAAGLRRAIEEKLPTMPLVPSSLANQIKELDTKLNELKQWKDYAVAPKRVELITEMEGLIGSTEAPQALADKIKQLQEDWKTISKGIVSDSEADWQRFHQASQAAYAPCKVYFETQAKHRSENLEKRRVLIARLTAFESAQNIEHPDYAAFTVVLREAPLEWRRYSHVDRAAGKASQQEYDALIRKLQQKLKAWHAGNEAEKLALIQRAEQFLGKEGREATEGIKQLQQLWKNIGSVERDKEQRLWMEFRKHCDAVFQKRDHAKTEFASALETNKKEAIALCEQVEQAAQLSGAALNEALARIAEWRSAFDALGELPRADARQLRDRFERALQRCQAQLSAARAREKAASITQILEASKYVNHLAWAMLSAEEAANREPVKQAAEAFIAGVTQWPKGGAMAVKDALRKAESPGKADLAGNEKALRTLCIRREIKTDTATPAEDQSLRRAYQVARLADSMNQRIDPRAEEYDAMALEWLRTGPVAPAVHESLLGRFLRCQDKA